MKHIGKHNDKKVVVVFREIPQEEHMCILVYSDLLPRLYHDAVMKVVESEAGQQASELNEILFRNLLPDGRGILTTLHTEGLMKKVPTNQVLMTPNAKSTARLDEINSILKKMKLGEEAIKELADMDAQQGLRDPKKNRKSETTIAAQVLSDASLAQNLRVQAAKMRSESQMLLTEAEKLEVEAAGYEKNSIESKKPDKPTPRRRKKV